MRSIFRFREALAYLGIGATFWKEIDKQAAETKKN